MRKMSWRYLWLKYWRYGVITKKLTNQSIDQIVYNVTWHEGQHYSDNQYNRSVLQTDFEKPWNDCEKKQYNPQHSKRSYGFQPARNCARKQRKHSLVLKKIIELSLTCMFTNNVHITDWKTVRKVCINLALDLSLKKSFMFRVETNENMNNWMESLERPENQKRNILQIEAKVVCVKLT